MTKEQNCTSCGVPATLTKRVPLCARCGLTVAEEALGFVFDGLRHEATTLELPSVPPRRMELAEADDVAHQRLAALRKQGAEKVTFRDLQDLVEITGRKRPWVYGWLAERVKDGYLIKDASQDITSWRFAR